MFCDLGRIMRDSFTRTATRINDDVKSAKGVLGFAKNEHGNMTMVFGFSMLCAVSFVGMTVDYGRGFATKAAMDRALDQAALAAGRAFDVAGDQAAAKKMARTYFFKALPTSIRAQLTRVDVAANGSIKMSARTSMRTMFLGAIGMPTIEIKRDAFSLAQDVNGVDSMKLEVALVMDVTGSMAQNSKLETAKTAAKRLIDTLIPPPPAGTTPPSNVRISIVPFSEYVNAGTYAEAATGVAASTASSYACTISQQVCTTVSNGNGGGGNGNNGNNGWGNGGDDGHNGSGNGGSGDWGSRSARHSGNGNDNGNGNGNGNNSGGNGNGNGGGSGTQQVCTTQLVQSTCQRTSYVNTCMAERLASSGHAYDDAAPSTSYFHAFTTTSAASTNCTAPDRPLLPLTNSRTDLYASVTALQPAGYTAGHIGTAWGWYTISDKWASFWPAASAPAVTNPAKVKKVVLVMTDGAYNLHYDANYASIAEDNSNNASVANGTSRSQAAAVCANMKAAGVEVFTIGLELGSDAASKTALQNCASPWNAQIAQHFYDVSSAASTQVMT